jgi:translation initiation factor 2B subunit (eIF-2B alpha/beta/delta family)
MDETPVVTCFLRNRGEVLLLRRSDAVGPHPGRWGAVAGHVAPSREGAAADHDPAEAVRREIREKTGLDDAATLVRRGDPFTVTDEDLATRWVVHPFCFDVAHRRLTPDAETSEHEWTWPPAILRRETVPELWTSYDRVRPTVATVAGDLEHGAATISVRALEVLRDEAAIAATADGETGDAWDAVASVARALLEARPSMAVVANRVNRAMDAALADRTPAAVERAATTAIGDALGADEAAAAAAADRVADKRLLTLSRSGTVRAVLDRGDPDRVLVAESRPGREGVAVAEELAADGFDVTLVPDAAVAAVLADGVVDAVVVGADTVLADGTVVNKVGTRATALACAREDVPMYAVVATDKISPQTTVELATTDPATVYDGTATRSVSAPLFDVTPPDLVADLVTESGMLDAAGVEAVAADHRDRATWTTESGA